MQAGASDYLAAKRMFLAWIGTGIALMRPGFVLARLGLFLQEFALKRLSTPPKSNPESIAIGIALSLLGVGTYRLSTQRHPRILKQLQTGEPLFARRARLAVGVAVLPIVLGLVMAGYLIFANPNTVVRASINREQSMVTSMATNEQNGIVRVQGKHSVDETVAKLQSLLQAKGVKLFMVVDHSGEAASGGLQMPNTKLLIFGNPKAGTPLMLEAPSVALDLPLKILVAEDASEITWVSYNAPAYLQARHGLRAELLPNIAVIEALVAKAAE